MRIDNYMEIGFAGFVDIVDAVGGVEINVTQNIKDPKAGINLKKGCQVAGRRHRRSATSAPGRAARCPTSSGPSASASSSARW